MEPLGGCCQGDFLGVQLVGGFCCGRRLVVLAAFLLFGCSGDVPWKDNFPAHPAERANVRTGALFEKN